MTFSLSDFLPPATELAVSGEPVLLDAGFARFDLFQSHEDRGDQFESLVRSPGEPVAHRAPPAPFSHFTQPSLNPSNL